MFYKKEFGLLKQTPKRFFKSPGAFRITIRHERFPGKNYLCKAYQNTMKQ